jgi:predicted lipoprotein with Yx(FWY)xxD motif
LKPSGPACTAKCLKIWPEVLLPKGVKKAQAGTGVSGAKLGTVKRAGGALQVTYSGKALYWFFEDTAAGQVKGVTTDTWGKWSVVVTKVPSSGSGGTTTTTSPSGGGGGF